MNSWAYLITTSYAEMLDKAVELGWKDKNVQVRVEFIDTTAYYYIEPFEKDCECRHILKYSEHIAPNP